MRECDECVEVAEEVMPDVDQDRIRTSRERQHNAAGSDLRNGAGGKESDQLQEKLW